MKLRIPITQLKQLPNDTSPVSAMSLPIFPIPRYFEANPEITVSW